jgi:hypothetical protein
VSLNSATAGLATALGPALGGLIVAAVGPGWAFIAAMTGYVGLLATIATSRPFETQQDRAGIGIAIATGVRYLRFSPGFLWLLLLGSLFGFTSAGLRAMLPNLTSDVLGKGATTYGVLLGLFGAGAIVGGLTRDIGSRYLVARIVPISITAFGLAGVVTGSATNLMVVGISVFIAGLLWSWILATLISTFQLLSPDWVRGRTMGAFVLSVFGILPLGAIAAGQLGSIVGPGEALVAFSLAVVGTGVIALKMPLPILEAAPVIVVNRWMASGDQTTQLLSLLAEVRRVRLSTGAYGWSVYRSVVDLRMFTEIYRIHSWDQHVQQGRRLDNKAIETLRHLQRYTEPNGEADVPLIAFDVDTPPSDAHWEDLSAMLIELGETENINRPDV